jgi:hypothetical protein
VSLDSSHGGLIFRRQHANSESENAMSALSAQSGPPANPLDSGLDEVAAFLIDQVNLAGWNTADSDRMQDLLFAYLNTAAAPEFCSH